MTTHTRIALTTAAVLALGIGVGFAGGTASGLVFASTDRTITPEITGYAPLGDGHVIRCGTNNVCWSTVTE